MVPLSARGSQGSSVDRQGRLGDSAGMARNSGDAAHDRARAMVALLVRPPVGRQRGYLLCAAVRHASMAAAGADVLEDLPQRSFDRPPVSVAAVSAQRRMDVLQQPAEADLLRDGLYRRANRDRDGTDAGARDFQQARMVRAGL